MHDNDRRLLTTAIIALDLIIKDCIERDRASKPMHETARYILEYVAGLINNFPDFDHNHQQYLLNVTEISADIKRIFLNSMVSDDDLIEMLELQKVRLRWLGTDPESGVRPEHGLH